MTPEEENLMDQMQRMLQGDVTPQMVPVLNDAAIHVALLSGMSVEQIVLMFAQQLGSHIPGVVGVEMRLYGNPALHLPQQKPPQVSVPKPYITAEEDRVAQKLLNDIELDL